jgi:hypothetical protein
LTAISVLLNQKFISFASDSLITIPKKDGSLEIVETEKPKIVQIPKLRAGIVFWGLSGFGRWSLTEYLKNMITNNKSNSLEEFCDELKVGLQNDFDRLKLTKPTPKYGLGVQVAGFERINDYRVPELFLISNFKKSYLVGSQFFCNRHSFQICTLKFDKKQIQPEAKHREYDYRKKVYDWLAGEEMIITNNGDYEMYTPLVKSLIEQIYLLRKRGVAKPLNDSKIVGALARLPIEIISVLQRDFCKEGSQIIGGKSHDLVITANGEFLQDTKNLPGKISKIRK